MSERKPANLSFQSWVELQILDAAERGEFDGLDGEGKPIADVDHPRDELWWVRQKLRREGVDYLPPAIAIRKTHDDALRRGAAARSEAEIRSILEPVNAEIVYLNSHTVSGPPTTVAPINVDQFVDRWRHARDPHGDESSDAHRPAVAETPAHAKTGRRRWPWRLRR